MPHQFDLARIGAGLIVATAEDTLREAATGGALVVSAPPGTGKTTFVPPLLAQLTEGRVVVTQPRRVAVRAAARRVAELDRSPVGGPVGFTVRGERAVSADTRIEFVTPGILIRRLLADPGLESVSAVVIDEVHERSVETDLLLALLAEVRTLREDLMVTAMSATVDADAVADLIGAQVVDLPWALHPLRIDHQPSRGPRLDARGVSEEYLLHLAEVTARAHTEEGTDALVFVPGAREVDTLVRLLAATTDGVDVLPLHGQLDARAQDHAVRGRASDASPRIVVSTAIAESSLTVPGVQLVVDAGLSREIRRDRGRDMTGLVTVGASRTSLEQRAGRAARLGPGRAVRVFPESDVAHLPAVAAPEIMAADLTDTALLLAVWGTPAGIGLSWLTPPPAESMTQAVDILQALDLVDRAGHPTALGRRVARMPIGVRPARALVDADGDRRTVAETVAAMTGDHRCPQADLSRLLADLRSGRAPGSRAWQRESARLTRIATTERPDRPGSASPGRVVALARPDRIARRTGDGSRSYLLASGTRAALPGTSSLLGQEWLAVWEVQRAAGQVADGTGAVIRLAAPLSQEDALATGEHLVTTAREAVADSGEVRVRQVRRLGAIILSSTPVATRPEDTGPVLAAELSSRGVDALVWSAAATSLRRRLSMLHMEMGDPWPAVDDESLLAVVAERIALDPPRTLAGIDLVGLLRGLLPWPQASRLDELAPERLVVPSGSTIRIDYPEPGVEPDQPVVAVKLQEVFGLAETPRLVDGRVPILFHLLSPARRPLAVTSDLRSFWDGPYAEVRKQMRGRYPKHPWPENPWTAQATARTKPHR